MQVAQAKFHSKDALSADQDSIFISNGTITVQLWLQTCNIDVRGWLGQLLFKKQLGLRWEAGQLLVCHACHASNACLSYEYACLTCRHPIGLAPLLGVSYLSLVASRDRKAWKFGKMSEDLQAVYRFCSWRWTSHDLWLQSLCWTEERISTALWGCWHSEASNGQGRELPCQIY